MLETPRCIRKLCSSETSIPVAKLPRYETPCPATRIERFLFYDTSLVYNIKIIGFIQFVHHFFADWSLTTYRARQIAQAQQLAEQSLAFAEQDQDLTALAQSLNMLGILARARGDLDQASDVFNRSLRTAETLGRLDLRCAALHNLARLEQGRGHPDNAVRMARQALEYCTLLGDRHHQASLLNTLVDLHHALGNESESMRYLKQTVALFAEIREDVGWEQPEIWKLTEW